MSQSFDHYLPALIEASRLIDADPTIQSVTVPLPLMRARPTKKDIANLQRANITRQPDGSFTVQVGKVDGIDLEDVLEEFRRSHSTPRWIIRHFGEA